MGVLDIVLVPDKSSNRQLRQADFKTRSGLGLPGGQTWTVRAAVIRDSKLAECSNSPR